ncbi:TerD family protein [Nocardia suismassiliense]|uniref:TerD family protein n=1 Tax=Nocardia suismassiliense TaxID=2077092 RepID=UPI000D1F8631|nr:TerD family protein [Nocardia suismassiliense]
MTVQLARGQVNVLEAEHIVVSVRHGAAVDLSALLLTANGMVRSDADLVFYNQPLGEGVRLVPGEGGQPGALAIDLRVVPVGIEHVRIVVALDDQQDSLGNYPAPELRIDDTAGNRLYEFVIDGSGAESTVVALDLDRGDPWRLRALGHGYRSGFAALVSAHGVAVGRTPKPVRQLPDPEMASALATAQELALRNPGGAELSHVKMALGWDPVREPGRFGLREVDIDLDASALVFSGRELLDAAFYGHLSSKDGSVRHQGDNLTGAGRGDNEMIDVDLTKLSPEASTVIFVVTSYAGHTFERVRNAFWRLVDGTTDIELTGGSLRVGGKHTGMVVAKVQREADVWKFRALGAPIQAGHPVEAAEQVAPFL